MARARRYSRRSPLLQHARQRLVVGNLPQVDSRPQVDGRALAAPRFLDAAPAPADLLGTDAMLVLQDAPDPDIGRDLVLRHADDPAAQVLGRGNAPVGPHIDARLAEHARDERRYGDIVVVAPRRRHHVAAHRDLGHVELAIAEGAVERFFRFEGDGGDLAALDGRPPIEQGAGTVIAAAGETDTQGVHVNAPLGLQAAPFLSVRSNVPGRRRPGRHVP